MSVGLLGYRIRRMGTRIDRNLGRRGQGRAGEGGRGGGGGKEGEDSKSAHSI